MNDNNRVAIYIRVSTDMQADKDSLPMQRRDLTAYAKLMLNTDNYTVFEDAGYSGKNTHRPAFQDMMTRVRAGEFTHILVWKIDRISRNLLDFSQMYSELKDLGVTFVSKNEQFDTSSAMGEAMLKIILVFAELERNMTSERVIATMVSKASQGEWNGGHIPLGYQYDKETKTFVIDNNEAATVHAIFDRYEEFRSMTTLVRWLTANGYHTKAGRLFCAPTVQSILQSEFYLGTYVYNKFEGESRKRLKNGSELVRYENHHPAIISREQYDRVTQIRIKNHKVYRSRDTKRIHVFGRHAMCGVCGRMMSPTPASDRDKWDHSNYLCLNGRPPATSCNNKIVSDSVVGEYFINMVLNILNAHNDRRNINSPEELQPYILSGSTFNYIKSVNSTDLTELYNILHSITVNKGRLLFRQRTSKRAVRSDVSIIKMQRTNTERALSRLTELYLHDPVGMPIEEYAEKRSELQEKLSDLTRQLSEASRKPAEMADQDFMQKASEFIIQKELSNRSYIYYKRLATTVDHSVLADFVDSILDTITMKYGKMTAISFRNGLTLRFILK